MPASSKARVPSTSSLAGDLSLRLAAYDRASSFLPKYHNAKAFCQLEQSLPAQSRPAPPHTCAGRTARGECGRPHLGCAGRDPPHGETALATLPAGRCACRSTPKNLDSVRASLRKRLRAPASASQGPGMQNFDGDVSIRTLIVGPKYYSHPPGADLLEHAVMSKDLTDHDRCPSSFRTCVRPPSPAVLEADSTPPRTMPVASRNSISMHGQAKIQRDSVRCLA